MSAGGLTFNHQSPSFPAEGNEAKLTLTPQQIEQYALQPFDGKELPAAGEQKKAVIFWGPPGSGKTTQGSNDFNADVSEAKRKKYITISYDEHGAIEAIPEYQKQNLALQAQWKAAVDADAKDKIDALYQQRLELYRRHRDDSQRIRSMTFNEAVERGHNLLVDITASGKGALMMLDKLKSEGYQVEVKGYLASSDVSEERVFKRGVKVVEPGEVYSKRVQAYENLPELMKKADKLSLLLNEQDGQKAAPVFTMEKGKVTQHDAQQTAALSEIFDRDVSSFLNHPQQSVRDQADKLALAVEAVEAPLREAAVLPSWQAAVAQPNKTTGRQP